MEGRIEKDDVRGGIVRFRVALCNTLCSTPCRTRTLRAFREIRGRGLRKGETVPRLVILRAIHLAILRAPPDATCSDGASRPPAPGSDLPMTSPPARPSFYAGAPCASGDAGGRAAATDRRAPAPQLGAAPARSHLPVHVRRRLGVALHGRRIPGDLRNRPRYARSGGLVVQGGRRRGRPRLHSDAGIRTQVGRAVDERTYYSIEYRIEADDGSMQWLDGILLDVTSRKKAEEAPRRMNETLEKKVRERMRQVRRLSAELAMAERRERDPIAPQPVVPETRPGLAQKATFVHPIPALAIPALAIRLDAEAAALRPVVGSRVIARERWPRSAFLIRNLRSFSVRGGRLRSTRRRQFDHWSLCIGHCASVIDNLSL